MNEFNITSYDITRSCQCICLMLKIFNAEVIINGESFTQPSE